MGTKCKTFDKNFLPFPRNSTNSFDPVSILDSQCKFIDYSEIFLKFIFSITSFCAGNPGSYVNPTINAGVTGPVFNPVSVNGTANSFVRPNISQSTLPQVCFVIFEKAKPASHSVINYCPYFLRTIY